MSVPLVGVLSVRDPISLTFVVLVPCRQPMNLPVAPVFSPSVTIIVRDMRLGGMVKTIVGIATVHLSDKIPWFTEYKPPCRQV